MTLLPSLCPFCKAEVSKQPFWFSTDSLNTEFPYSIMCWNCGADGPVASTVEDAITSWDEAHERVLKLKKLLNTVYSYVAASSEDFPNDLRPTDEDVENVLKELTTVIAEI